MMAAVLGPIGVRLTNSKAGNSYLGAHALLLLAVAVTTSSADLLPEARSKPRGGGAEAPALANFTTLVCQQVLHR